MGSTLEFVAHQDMWSVSHSSGPFLIYKVFRNQSATRHQILLGNVFFLLEQFLSHPLPQRGVPSKKKTFHLVHIPPPLRI